MANGDEVPVGVCTIMCARFHMVRSVRLFFTVPAGPTVSDEHMIPKIVPMIHIPIHTNHL